MKEIMQEYGELAMAGIVALAVLGLVGMILEGPILQEIVNMCTLAF